MDILLSKKHKIELLNAVKSGKLDTTFIEKEINKRDENETLDDVNKQIIQCEVLDCKMNPQGFRAKADLMLAFANKQISESEYKTKRFEQIKDE